MKPLVIKLGGALLDQKEAMDTLFNAIKVYLSDQARPLVIVHGGGCLVDELLTKLSLPVVRRNGLRVTPPEQIDIIVGALAGSANKRLLAEAKKKSIKSVGLCVSDGDTLHVTKMDDELGNVGEVTAHDNTLVTQLLNSGYLPIFSSIGVTDSGDMMNINADHAAVEITKVLNGDLLFLSDVAGVLDADKEKITYLNYDEAQTLIKCGVINGGMAVKVNSAFEAVRSLNHPIDIASWKAGDALIQLFKGEPVGTRLVL